MTCAAPNPSKKDFICLTLRAAAEEKTHPLTVIMGFQIKSSNFKLHFVTITNTKIVIKRLLQLLLTTDQDLPINPLVKKKTNDKIKSSSYSLS